VLLLAYVAGLFMAQTAPPASRSEMLFNVDFALCLALILHENLGSLELHSSLQLGHLLLVAVLGAQSRSKQSQQ